jgi:Tol biopolymer transport system component
MWIGLECASLIRGGKSMRRRILRITFLALAPIACETPGAAPHDIVYVSQAGGSTSLHIWRMKPDGADQRALTTGDDVQDNFPALSPDGTRILFTSNRGLSGDRKRVFSMDADGGNLRAIGPADPAFVGYPSWSPDGRQILFSAGEDLLDLDLYVMNADGTGVRQLTSSPGSERCGEWAPDGSRILYDWNVENHFDLMTIDRSGENAERLLPDGFEAECGDWSPDGRWVAFASPTDHVFPPLQELEDWNPVFAVYTIDVQTGDIRQLTPDEGRSSFPKWSRDGSRIVFHSTIRIGTPPGGLDSTNGRDIYTMLADGSGLRRLTTNDVFDGHPSW